MSATRFSRLQKATALVPLAMLSAAWTVNVTGLTASSALASASPSAPPATLPDGTTIPSRTIGAPATVSSPATDDNGLSDKTGSNIVASANSSGIPAAALAAYQRAATVIDNADKSCNIDWPLIAAIGRVESNHGRANGNRLSAKGISTPGIFGPALTGRKGTTQIVDSDGGQYDGDTKYDRAVGPMQFIPSTWSMVGVDADGDGKRNPQDINDAALATAVYLCAGSDDLSTMAGQRSAVFRYNHSQPYVATVLGVASAYRAGDYTSVPNSTITTDYVFTPDTPSAPHIPSGPRHTGTGAPGGDQGGGSNSGDHTIKADPGPSSAPSPTGAKHTDSPKNNPSPSPTTNTNPGNTATDVGKNTQKTVEDTAASVAELTKVCTAALTSKYGQAPSKAVTACVNKLTGDTLTEAQQNVGSVVAGLADLVSDLLGGLLGGLTGN